MRYRGRCEVDWTFFENGFAFRSRYRFEVLKRNQKGRKNDKSVIIIIIVMFDSVRERDYSPWVRRESYSML